MVCIRLSRYWNTNQNKPIFKKLKYKIYNEICFCCFVKHLDVKYYKTLWKLCFLLETNKIQDSYYVYIKRVCVIFCLNVFFLRFCIIKIDIFKGVYFGFIFNGLLHKKHANEHYNQLYLLSTFFYLELMVSINEEQKYKTQIVLHFFVRWRNERNVNILFTHF